MIRAFAGDITKLTDVDYICNAANGIGVMGGGVAGAIARAGGQEIVQDAIRVCREQNPREGDLYVTTAGKLPYKAVLHLVTMKSPGSRARYDTVRNCLYSLIRYCRQHQIRKVALPALGTGVGGLDYREVANIYRDLLGTIEDIEFLVVDINAAFIDCFK